MPDSGHSGPQATHPKIAPDRIIGSVSPPEAEGFALVRASAFPPPTYMCRVRMPFRWSEAGQSER